MKSYATMLLLLAGVLPLYAQPTEPTFHLYITKIELSGKINLVWTKPASLSGAVQYELYRAKVADSTAFHLIKKTNDTLYTDTVPTVITELSNTYAFYVLAKSGAFTYKSDVKLIPVPGIPLIGAFRLEGKIESGKVKLAWDAPPINTPVNYYLVYSVIPGMTTLIDSTSNLWSLTNVPAAVPAVVPLKIVFYVKAKLLSGQMLESTTLLLTISDSSEEDEVKFVSAPPRFGQVNKKYEYTANAVSNDAAAIIRYSGHAQNLDGWTVIENFTIDSASGVIDWTPQKKGWYRVSLLAKSSQGGFAKQEFTVTVAGGNGVVQGKVSDTLNTGITGAVINAYKVEQNMEISFAYSARTDENGNYRMTFVDPGSYKLFAQSPSTKYLSQWYDGKTNTFEADIISVPDSAATTANFKLRGGPANQPKTAVTGTVTDTLGLAISNANCRVVFARAEFALNFCGSSAVMENFRKYFEFNAQDDFRIEGSSEFIFKSRPDSATGKYTVELPAGRYIAFARARGYATEFYNGEPDLLSARIISIPFPPGEIPLSIDFTLTPLPAVVLGGISGAVLDSAKGIFIPARVIAFRDRWRFAEKHRIARAYVTDTDSSGKYSFDELLPGIYVVMAIPMGEYAPAFYAENDMATFRWKRATTISINGNSIDNINIYVSHIEPSASGFTGIEGTVSVSEGNGEMHGSMEGTLKAGAIVYARKGSEVAGYAFTNADGSYEISSLAPGSYSVFVDKLGFEESSTTEVSAEYSSSGAPISGTADFTISSFTPSATSTNDNVVQPTKYALHQNYPNPFNPSTTISYSLPNAGKVKLTVYDLLGKDIATLVNGYQNSGRYDVSFSAPNLSSGIYFYRLRAGSYNVVKKMILIK